MHSALANKSTLTAPGEPPTDSSRQGGSEGQLLDMLPENFRGEPRPPRHAGQFCRNPSRDNHSGGSAEPRTGGLSDSLQPGNGGLPSYGADFGDIFHRAARYVDSILRGVKPSELPVQLPIKYMMVINLKTAKALGLTIPPPLLGRTDEIIQ